MSPISQSSAAARAPGGALGRVLAQLDRARPLAGVAEQPRERVQRGHVVGQKLERLLVMLVRRLLIAEVLAGDARQLPVQSRLRRLRLAPARSAP